VSPGLYKHEKDMIKYAMLPALTLFASGAAFAYFIIVPFMMKFVLYYTRVLGVEPTLSLKAFVNTVVSLTMATGVAFEYPLVMGALTFLGVVGARTWRRNWRWGVLGAFVIAWMISPGTTGGVIETTIGIILSALYFVGVAAAYTIEEAQTRTKRVCGPAVNPPSSRTGLPVRGRSCFTRGEHGKYPAMLTAEARPSPGVSPAFHREAPLPHHSGQGTATVQPGCKPHREEGDFRILSPQYS
jgi:hypothetical protein